MSEAARDAEPGPVDEPPGRSLIAWYGDPKPTMKIVPASRWRQWMNDSIGRGANRCLPLLVANEAGWMILNERRFTADWNGGKEVEDLTIRYDGRQPDFSAISNFGDGIVTFPMPFLFRTDAGWDLWVRGPTNMPKDGIAPLDGLVEADWSFTTFTMNWCLTRPGSVTFEEDEPICMLMPQRRHDLETFAPAVRAVREDPDIAAVWEEASRQRHAMQVRNWLSGQAGQQLPVRETWSADYFKGQTVHGERFDDHVPKRRLKPFVDVDEAP